jgi:hypothetical protein
VGVRDEVMTYTYITSRLGSYLVLIEKKSQKVDK